uniref:Uncharacterized protein n=1 Tax=Kryptolebias marmoratus TaxID=37003 RepID=A0A3Q3A541_KRYMA
TLIIHSVASICLQGGLYFLQLFDHYVCSGNNLLLLSVCQSIAVGWIYGADLLYDNIEDMIGYCPWPLMKICWLYVTPAVCLGTFIFSVVRYKPLKFNKTYIYPEWAYALGWFLGLFCVLLVPMWIIFKMTQMEGTVRHSSKNTVLPIQPLGGSQREEELAAVGVRSGVGHRKDPSPLQTQKFN